MKGQGNEKNKMTDFFGLGWGEIRWDEIFILTFTGTMKHSLPALCLAAHTS